MNFLTDKWDEHKARQQARSDARTRIMAFSTRPVDDAAVEGVRQAVRDASSLMKSADLRKTLDSAWLTQVNAFLSDDVMTVDEEQQLFSFADALGMTYSDVPRLAEAWRRVEIARVNDGRLPVVHSPTIMTKKNEIVHGEFAASLMKEVVVRQFQGGSSGFSVPVGGGIRFRTGSFKGRSVVVGTQLQQEDAGTLAVTSTRAVFAGSKKTLEMRWDKLVNLEGFADGLRFNVSNRQKASLFQVPAAELAACMISAAAAQAIATT